MKKSITWSAVALLAIVIAAFFVRTYKFDEWLYFKMDQSRDAMMIANAVENGPQYLPLLGPRVGAVKLQHGMLRVGPIFYYFQYAAGVLFHSTKAYVFAYPDLFFSMLTIPLLYLFSRLYFSRKNSLLITAMYAFSFIIIQYSRFAWNPNSLQFFLLLSFYGLLKFLDEPQEKHKKWWLALWAIGMAVGSQLHFLGFFGLLGISGVMIIFHYEIWKKENVASFLKKETLKIFAKYVGITAIVFAIFYMPVIISDVYKNGQNSKNFIEALSSKPANKPLSEKITKSATENLKYYCLITTSDCYESGTKMKYPAITVTAFILLAGIILIIRKLRQKKITAGQKNFLVLIIVWVGVFTALTIPVSFQLRPRFFIVVFAIPFISLGFLFEYFEEKIKRNIAIALSLLLSAGIIAWNTHGTYAWFKEQAASQKKVTTIKRTLILKAKDGVTLGQLQKVADWMYARHKPGATLYFYVKPEHVRPIEFLLWQKHDKELRVETLKLNEDANAQFFAITPDKSGLDAIYAKYGKNNISMIAQQQFGQLLVSEINIDNRSTSPNFRFNKSSKKTDRIFWKDVFGIKDDKSNKDIIPISGNE